jgi:hypothetical protein
MKNDKDTKARIAAEEDYIYNPKMGNSLKKMVSRYPDGVDDKKIAKVLMMSMNELEKRYNAILKRIRKKLKIKIDNE